MVAGLYGIPERVSHVPAFMPPRIPSNASPQVLRVGAFNSPLRAAGSASERHSFASVFRLKLRRIGFSPGPPGTQACQVGVQSHCSARLLAHAREWIGY